VQAVGVLHARRPLSRPRPAARLLETRARVLPPQVQVCPVQGRHCPTCGEYIGPTLSYLW